MTLIPIPPEFLDFLSRTYPEGTGNPAHQPLIEETWNTAVLAAVPKPSTAPTDLVLAHTRLTDPLLERVLMVRDVIRNTLNKFDGEVPPHLLWASEAYYDTRVVGIFRENEYDALENISQLIKDGTFTVKDSDVVRVSAITGYADHLPFVADIPVYTLSRDPIAVAQATRFACFRHANKLKLDLFNENKRRRAAMARQITDLQNQMSELDEVIGVVETEREAEAAERAVVVQAQVRRNAAARALAGEPPLI